MNYEEFCTYEQAEHLKELGFDWKCVGFYNKYKIATIEHDMGWDGGMIIEENYNNAFLANNYDVLCSAPTLAQAQHWMLEKFGLWIEVTRDTIETKRFSCGINHADDVYREWVGMFDNIFDALSKGIDKALELLKEQ